VARRARVGINGFGVIGKRVADAVSLQDHMELVGVADVVHDYRVCVAVERGYPVFASDPARRPEMEAAGIPVAGTLDDLLARAEIIVDCTPKRVGAENRQRYRAAGVKAVWQGGEEHEVAGDLPPGNWTDRDVSPPMEDACARAGIPKSRSSRC
jgi:glyceraldehyde-3-phosphate dehydrogenase (NAD(P))